MHMYMYLFMYMYMYIYIWQPNMFRGSFDAAITWSETPRFTMLITEYDNSAVAAASSRPLTYASTLESYSS